MIHADKLTEMPCDEIQRKQEEWFDEAVADEICRLINKGYNEREILENFSLRFPQDELGNSLLDFKRHGYNFKDGIITIKNPLM